MTPPLARFTLFPYTTLFRSRVEPNVGVVAARTIDPGDAQGDKRPPIRQRHIGVDERHLDQVVQRFLLLLRQLWTQIRRSEEHTSELQSLAYLVCRLLLEKKN